MAYLSSLQEPDTFGDEACSDKVQEACGDDEEDLQRRAVSSLVDKVADDCASKQTTDYRKRESIGWKAQSHAA